jgi:hypothetical protein
MLFLALVPERVREHDNGIDTVEERAPPESREYPCMIALRCLR